MWANRTPANPVMAALIGASEHLRRAAQSGAGIAILYATFFAAHSLYGLLPLSLTFALMALVTVLAGVLAELSAIIAIAVVAVASATATAAAGPARSENRRRQIRPGRQW